MRRFLLSISSSDTLHLESGDHRWRGAIASVVTAVVVLGCAELGARALLKPIGRGWEYWQPLAAAKFEFVRNSIDVGASIRVLVVGDSTGAADLDPASFERELGGLAWNAASSGNFPLAFERTTLPLLENSKLKVDYVIASFITSGFNAGEFLSPSEAAIVSSQFVQRQDTGWLTGDYVYLARFKTGWPFLFDSGRRLPASARRYGFDPSHQQVSSATIAGETLVSSHRPLTSRRTSVLARTISAARSRHFVLAVIVPPSLSRSPERIETTAEYVRYLRVEEAKGGLRVFDFSGAAFLKQHHFEDLNHLNAQGAALLSADVGRRLAALRADEASKTYASH